MSSRKIIGGPVVIGGRTLSLSRAVEANGFVFLTGQTPFKNGEVMTTGIVEERTRAVLDDTKSMLASR